MIRSINETNTNLESLTLRGVDFPEDQQISKNLSGFLGPAQVKKEVQCDTQLGNSLNETKSKLELQTPSGVNLSDMQQININRFMLPELTQAKKDIQLNLSNLKILNLLDSRSLNPDKLESFIEKCSSLNSVIIHVLKEDNIDKEELRNSYKERDFIKKLNSFKILFDEKFEGDKFDTILSLKDGVEENDNNLNTDNAEEKKRKRDE